MIKKILLILLICSANNLYSQETEKFSNHAVRLYGSVGTGYPFLNAGAGASYTYEFGNLGTYKNIFFGISADAQVNAPVYPTYPMISNYQISLSVGRRLENGGRFAYDIVGSGVAIVYNIEENSIQHGFQENNPFHYLLNFFSFHYTFSNGLYLSWRNNLILPMVNYRSYITVGFDFSKLFKPEIYNPRKFKVLKEKVIKPKREY